MIADRENRVRARAHQIWLDEGCPEGRAEEHWSRAEQDVDAEAVPARAKPKAPPKPKVQKAPAEKKVSAATKPAEAAAPKARRTAKAKAPA